jgi:uncharacterized protein
MRVRASICKSVTCSTCQSRFLSVQGTIGARSVYAGRTLVHGMGGSTLAMAQSTNTDRGTSALNRTRQSLITRTYRRAMGRLLRGAALVAGYADPTRWTTMASRLPYGLCALLMCAPAAFAADIPDYPFVFVAGKADVDTPPDMATCTLTLRAIDRDSGKAEVTINDRLKSALETLSANHVSPRDIESFNVNKQILMSEESIKGPASIRGYDMSRGLKFTSRHLDSLPGIENVLIGSPNIENINCRFDRADRAAIEAGLVTKALHAAREEADKLAGPLGRHVTTAVAVSKSPFDSIAALLGLGDQYGAAAGIDRLFKKAVASGDELLIPSTIAISAKVNVLFKME